MYQDFSNQVDYLKGLVSGLVSKVQSTDPTEPPPTEINSYAAVTKRNENVVGISNGLPTKENVTIDKVLKPLFSLPNKDIDVLVLGDSITNRLNQPEIGPDAIVRGYGGARVSDLYEKVSHTRKKKVKSMFLAFGINDILKEQKPDIKMMINNMEKLIYLVNDKFNPRFINIVNLTPLASYNKDKNVSVDKFNKELQKIHHQLSDLPDDLTFQFLELNSLFKDKDYLNTDGVHPNVSGVETIVKSYRSCLADNDIPCSSGPITMRERLKPNAHNNKYHELQLNWNELSKLLNR